MKALTFPVILSALILSVPAMADEVWTTDEGEVVYEADLDNGMAVLAMPGEGKMFLAGLAGEYEGRETYEGIWIASSDYKSCDFAIENPQTGETSYNWGRVRLTFIDPDFPGRWVATGSECMNPPNEDPIVGLPVVPEE